MLDDVQAARVPALLRAPDHVRPVDGIDYDQVAIERLEKTPQSAVREVLGERRPSGWVLAKAPDGRGPARGAGADGLGSCVQELGGKRAARRVSAGHPSIAALVITSVRTSFLRQRATPPQPRTDELAPEILRQAALRSEGLGDLRSANAAETTDALRQPNCS